jgi:hypothetical protein
MVDRELSTCNVLFEDTGRPRFAIKRVYGAHNPRQLAQNVKTFKLMGGLQ